MPPVPLCDLKIDMINSQLSDSTHAGQEYKYMSPIIASQEQKFKMEFKNQTLY